METNPDSPAQARCPRCGGEMVCERVIRSGRAAAILALAMAAGVAVLPQPAGPDWRCAGVAAALVLAVVLLPERLRWRCPSCRAKFPCRRPPRGSGGQRVTEDQEGGEQ